MENDAPYGDFSSCRINHFRNGTIICGFTLGFRHPVNISRFNRFINRTLATQTVFGGPIITVEFDLAGNMSGNDTDDFNNSTSGRFGQAKSFIISNDNTTQTEQYETTQTMHTTIDQGLSVTITINKKNLPSMNKKLYKLIFIPIIEYAENQINTKQENLSINLTDGIISMLSLSSFFFFIHFYFITFVLLFIFSFIIVRKCFQFI